MSMMAVSTGQNGTDCLEGSDSHILTVNKHLIPFTGADRYNYNFIISGKPKGGTYQFWPDCAAFSGSITPTMAVSIEQNDIYCLEGSDMPHADRRQTSDPIHRRRQAQLQLYNWWQVQGWNVRFETYATMQAVFGKRLPTVAVVRLTDDTAKVKFVRKLLSESKNLELKKSTILMDRELGNVEVMRFLDEYGENS